MDHTRKGGDYMRYLGILALLCVAGGASAGILWDNGPFDEGYAIGNGKGTNTYFGQVDLQAADDFALEVASVITDFHFEGLSLFGTLQVDYITFELFEDTGGGLPKEDPFVSLDVYNITVTAAYDPNWGYYRNSMTGYLNVTVPAGYYWVKMQPYGLAGDWHYQGCTTQDWGQSLAVRNGPWGGGHPTDYWTHGSYAGYDLNFQLTGQAVPEPGVFTALAGLVLGAGAILRRR
jgi:hypothetical protein